MFNLLPLLYLVFVFYISGSKIGLQHPAWDITNSDYYARIPKARRAIFRKAHQSNLSISSNLLKEVGLNLFFEKKMLS